MKRILTFVGILFLGIVSVYGEPGELAKLYNTLDSVIAKSDDYKEIAEKRKARLRQQFADSRGLARRYELAMKLYDEYKAFNNDSAIYYINKCIELAVQLDDKTKENLSRVRLAFQCSSTGMYNEAVDILEKVDTGGASREVLGEYYTAYVHVYGELAYYTKLKNFSELYYKKREEYRKLMFATLDANSDTYLQGQEIVLSEKNNLVKALQINNLRLKGCDEYSRNFAIVAFYRYLDHKLAGDLEQGKSWLVKSAIADIQNAVMDQGSMWELANLLMREGDLERSHRYINFAWECAKNFGTRVRSWQVSPVLSTVDRKYQEETDKANRLLLMLVVSISIMFVLLLLSLLYVNKQRKRLSASQQKLRESNSKLLAANDNMSSLIDRLQDTNNQLSQLNRQISEANNVKEEYIGRFLQLCSQYVDKMESMRKSVSKMLKNRDYNAIMDMMRSADYREKELNELYSNFDKAFLHLFPNFVREFNAMLKPEERVPETPGNESLPTMVRIFALIRLGIDDSSKIAYFLHYSVNTIYNYRARVKNAALSDRGNFEARIKKIGMPE